MVSLQSAEKFVKSKTALLAGAIVLIGLLIGEITRLHVQANSDQIDNERKLAAKDSIIYVRDSTIFDCKEQQKITADNATKAEQQRGEEYKKMLFQYIALKSEVNKITKK